MGGSPRDHADPSEVGSSLLEVLITSGVRSCSSGGQAGAGRGGYQLLEEVGRLAGTMDLVGDKTSRLLGIIT